jgi:predicted nucleotidyltransferase
VVDDAGLMGVDSRSTTTRDGRELAWFSRSAPVSEAFQLEGNATCASTMIWRMRLLKRAGFETTRALGLNVPTAVKIAFFVLLSLIVRPITENPDTASSEGLDRGIAEFLPWLASLLIVFTFLLVWNCVKLARQDQSTREQLKMNTDHDRSVDDAMILFLSNVLMDTWFGIARCYAFGSVVRRDRTRDVDIIIQFSSSKAAKIRIYRYRLRSIEKSFQEYHDKKLHIQTFLSTEDAELQIFLQETGAYKLIMERR